MKKTNINNSIAKEDDKIFQVKQEALRKAYIKAEQCSERKKLNQDWQTIDAEGWE